MTIRAERVLYIYKKEQNGRTGTVVSACLACYKSLVLGRREEETENEVDQKKEKRTNYNRPFIQELTKALEQSRISHA